MNSASDTFFLSFHGPSGMCRISHGRCVKSAAEDAMQTAINTGLTSNILNNNLKKVGEIKVVPNAAGPLLPSSFAFFDGQGARQPLH